jgi:hypothetical protein
MKKLLVALHLLSLQKTQFSNLILFFLLLIFLPLISWLTITVNTDYRSKANDFSEVPPYPTPTSDAITSPTITSTPTNTTAPQPTATVSPAPPANKTPECTGISSLPAATATLLSKITLTCLGNDSDGYLTGAEFDFGDGNSRIITSIGGNNGRLVTEYRYAKAGTYGLACRVKDNNGSWSDIPTACRSSIRINNASVSPSATPAATVIITPTVTAFEQLPTPEPSPEQEINPIPENELIEENPMQRVLLIAGAALIGTIALMIIGSRLANKEPPVIRPPTS